MPSSSPCLFLFNRLVQTYPAAADVGNSFPDRVLTSQDKQAFGFDAQDEADSAVKGLVLEADLDGLPGLSSLSLLGGNPHAYSCIHSIDKGLILIVAGHPKDEYTDVFLIYNAMDRSLRMIPHFPVTYPPIRTAFVLVARQDDKDRSYALVFPGTDDEGHAVLFVSPSSSKSPWSKLKKANFPWQWRSDMSYFRAQVVFSFHGRGYWVDLLCGGMYCECGDVLSDDIISVDIKSFYLPLKYDEYLGPKGCVADARAFRTMGPVGDSIKFVSIDGCLELVDFKDWKVLVWRLTEDMNWDLEYELRLVSLLPGGEFYGVNEFYKVNVPAEGDSWAPMYPMLSTHEDDVIYFGLGNWILGEVNCIPSEEKYFPDDPLFLVRVDLCSKTFKWINIASAATDLWVHLALYSDAKGKLLGLPAEVAYYLRDSHKEAQEEYQES